jgi:hypothetical protein
MYKLAQLELDYQMALSRGEKPKARTLDDIIQLPPGVEPIIVKPEELPSEPQPKSDDKDLARMLAEAVTGQDELMDDSEESEEPEEESDPL